MKFEVYLDVVFVIQLVLDYCILKLTAEVMRLKTSQIRILLSSLLGAVGCCIMLLPMGINGKFKIFTTVIFFGSLMTIIAFRVRGIRQYISLFLMITSSGFLLGGAARWCMNFMGHKFSLPISILVIAAVCRILIWGLQQYRKQHSPFMPVTLRIRNADGGLDKITVVALVDTGNRLAEPLTGKPVCIISEGIVSILQSQEYRITYHALGNDDGHMKAHRIEEMIIHTKEGDVSAKDVMLALYPGKISKKDAYHMILHPAYLKEEGK